MKHSNWPICIVVLLLTISACSTFPIPPYGPYDVGANSIGYKTKISMNTYPSYLKWKQGCPSFNLTEKEAWNLQVYLRTFGDFEVYPTSLANICCNADTLMFRTQWPFFVSVLLEEAYDVYPLVIKNNHTNELPVRKLYSSHKRKELVELMSKPRVLRYSEWYDLYLPNDTTLIVRLAHNDNCKEGRELRVGLQAALYDGKAEGSGGIVVISQSPCNCQEGGIKKFNWNEAFYTFEGK